MSFPFLQENDDYSLYHATMMHRTGRTPRRFDEYYRCYPISMLPGPDRESANYGGKVFLPASALEKLTRLHITYPMLFELINGAKQRQTHAGVLEFIAEEGKIYLPRWLMNTLLLEAGDLVQIKSTDLPPGSFIKLQPQSPDFLDISDPKAVLENAFRNFSCLTKGDIFSFAYNEVVYDIQVLEVKPDTDSHAIYTMETDLSVDFAPPVGYKEPSRSGNGATTTRTEIDQVIENGKIHTQGTMAQAINWDAIRPSSQSSATKGVSGFVGEGHRLSNRRSGLSNPSKSPSLPIGSFVFSDGQEKCDRGAQPLRLPSNKLFFGWEFTPLKDRAVTEKSSKAPKFQGIGQTLRGKKVDSNAEIAKEQKQAATKAGSCKNSGSGRTLREQRKTGSTSHE